MRYVTGTSSVWKVILHYLHVKSPLLSPLSMMRAVKSSLNGPRLNRPFVNLRWLERVSVFFDALYLGVKIFRLELANRDHILPQYNDNIKVSIFCRFLKKFVAMATQLGFEV